MLTKRGQMISKWEFVVREQNYEVYHAVNGFNRKKLGGQKFNLQLCTCIQLTTSF